MKSSDQACCVDAAEGCRSVQMMLALYAKLPSEHIVVGCLLATGVSLISGMQ